MEAERARQLRDGVRQAYSAAAERPLDKHPFPVGCDFAQNLGYPADLLAALPSCCSETFSGVSTVSLWADLSPAGTVLDLGCGAGLDSLVAARRVGPSGSVIGVDFSEVMLARACQGATQTGLRNVSFCLAEAERLPLADGAIDVALVNGIFNLNPARTAIFRELARVVRPGGSVYSAELILREPLPPEMQAGESNWFA